MADLYSEYPFQALCLGISFYLFFPLWHLGLIFIDRKIVGAFWNLAVFLPVWSLSFPKSWHVGFCSSSLMFWKPSSLRSFGLEFSLSLSFFFF